MLVSYRLGLVLKNVGDAANPNRLHWRLAFKFLLEKLVVEYQVVHEHTRDLLLVGEVAVELFHQALNDGHAVAYCSLLAEIRIRHGSDMGIVQFLLSQTQFLKS